VRACSIAADEKSRPVILAPKRERPMVSVPMWHCRCTPVNPLRSPSKGRSNLTTSPMNAGSSMNRCTL